MTTDSATNNLIAEHLRALYGEARLGELMANVTSLIEQHRSSKLSAKPSPPLSERDTILIAYGDQVRANGESPLSTLNKLIVARLAGLISGVHILPFFPYSSDDGFSVIDYRKVNPDLGAWEDIQNIAAGSRLMVDAVINHISAQSEWAGAFRRGDPDHIETFIVVDPDKDLSKVVRPRDLPLLTPIETADGVKHVWTTFSTDQLDLNYANPNVMLNILDLLLFYVRKGAQIIRLDAIAFLWKQVGTPSIHLPQTHHAVKLMRAVLDVAAPGTLLISETNVPHEENLSYFGDQADQAQLVYQFALPPLTLHTLVSGNSSRLTEWTLDLEVPFEDVTFFNFLASHDGIGLRPVTEILNPEELDALIALPGQSGGEVSYRALPDGGRSPYELNVSYLDALTDQQQAMEVATQRFLAAHAIMLALPGLPGIYFHSLFGSRNDLAGVKRTSRARSINRQKLNLSSLVRELEDTGSERHRIFAGFDNLLRARSSHQAFDPYQDFQCIEAGSGVFALFRGDRQVLCVHEVAGRGAEVRGLVRAGSSEDLLSEESLDPSRIPLAPYQSRWIALESNE